MQQRKLINLLYLELELHLQSAKTYRELSSEAQQKADLVEEQIQALFLSQRESERSSVEEEAIVESAFEPQLDPEFTKRVANSIVRVIEQLNLTSVSAEMLAHLQGRTTEEVEAVLEASQGILFKRVGDSWATIDPPSVESTESVEVVSAPLTPSVEHLKEMFKEKLPLNDLVRSMASVSDLIAIAATMCAKQSWNVGDLLESIYDNDFANIEQSQQKQIRKYLSAVISNHKTKGLWRSDRVYSYYYLTKEGKELGDWLLEKYEVNMGKTAP